MAKKDSSRPQFQAVFTESEIEKAERDAQAYGIARRTAFATLTLSADALLAPMDEATGEAWLQAAKSIGEYLRWRKDETRLLKAAQARLFLALQWQADHGSLREVAHG